MTHKVSLKEATYTKIVGTSTFPLLGFILGYEPIKGIIIKLETDLPPLKELFLPLIKNGALRPLSIPVINPLANDKYMDLGP